MSAMQPGEISEELFIGENGKRAEDGVRASEEGFRAMFNLTSVGMAQVDAKTRRLLHVNAAFCAITGYSEAELLMLRVDDINHPDERDRDQERFINLIQGKTSTYQAEKRYLCKDGSTVWVIVTGNVIYDAVGHPLHVVTVVQNITDRKRTEEDLRKSEERFRLVTQAVNGLVFDWNLQTNEVYRSQKLYDLVGVYPKDAIPDASWWHERIHSDDLARLQPQVTELFAGSDQLYDSEYRVRHEDGHWVDVWEQGCLIRDEQGQVTRIVGCTVDISDRRRVEDDRQRAEFALREKEQQLHQLSDSMPQFVWICSATGELEYVNRQWLEFSGLALEQTRDRASLDKLYHPDDRQLAFDQWTIALETKQTFEIEARLQRSSDGAYRWFLIRAIPSFNEQGQVLRWYGTSTDIHERKRRELHDQFLNQLDIRLKQLANVQALIWETVSSLGEYLELSRCTFVEIDWQQGLATVERDWCRDVLSVAGTYAISDFITPEFQAALASGQTALVHDVATDPRTAAFASNYQALQTQAFANAPCIYQGHWVADLTISSKTPRVWREDEILLLQNTIARLWPLIEQTRAVQALRESEERFRISQELSLDAFTILDCVRDDMGRIVDFEWTYVNPKAAAILQHPANELVGQRLLDVLPGNRLNSELFERYVRVVETGESHDIELIYDTDGCTDWLRNMAVKLEDGVAVFFSDITDRKQSEVEREQLLRDLATERAKFEAVLQQMPAGVIIAEAPSGKLVLGNQQAEKIWRHAFLSSTEIDEYREYKGFHADGQPYEPEEWPLARSLLRGEVVVQEEIHFLRGDGTKGVMEVNSTPIYNQQGQIMAGVVIFQDITDRKQIEEALRTSEERLRFAVEGAALGTWEYDLGSSQIVWSERAKLMFGVPLNAEVDYETFMHAIHPDDRDRIHAAVEHAIAQQEIYDVEMRSVWADGSVHWIRSIGRSRYDHNAVPIRMIGVALDITNRKEAEFALQESESLLQGIIDNSALLVYVKDLEGRFILVNQQFERTFGRSKQDFIGKTDYDLFPQDLADAFRERDRLVMAGKPLEFEEIVPHSDGLHDYISIKFPLYNAMGQIYAICGISTDITDRKQAEKDLRESERRFRRLVESNMFGVAFGDFTGGIHYVNDYFLNMVGYTREEIETGQVRWLDITPPEFLPLDEKAAIELRTKGVATPFEKEYIRKDGSRVPILIGSALLQEPYDQQQEIIGFFIDLTEQKQAEAERERLLQQAQAAREEAETANRIKDEFLAVLSHELRSPLNPILGWSKLLQTRQLGEQGTQRALETIERNAKLQTQLIEDLLDVSRILRGKMVLNTCPVNLVTVIESALETVRLAAEAKQINIQTAFTSNNAQTLGDSARLQQIVWNLLSNAVKFTPDGGQIEVKLEQIGNWESGVGNQVSHAPSPIPHPPPYAQITVTDTGKGISSDFLPYVFDYFRQEDGKTTRKFGGLGLGLAIVRYLAELHGGTVYAESSGEGQGATFVVRLPLITNTEELGEELASITQSHDLSQLSILLVDDDEDMRNLAQVILEQEGIQVRVAASATEALALFDRHPPDILISDIGMPEMDGYMLMQQIRNRSPQQGGLVPAIALTAYAGEYDQQQALKVGFQRHVAKPVEPEALVRAIAEFVNRR